MDRSNTSQNAYWKEYFELTTGGLGRKYQYINTSVVTLPYDLPQPPSDYPVMFSGCHYLVNIDALAKWDTTNMTSTTGMFNHCHSLEDISPLRYWDLSNVTDMRYMFNCCYELADVSAIKMWDVPNVKHMRYIFNGCHKLPDFARFEVYDQHTFNYFVNRCLFPQLPQPIYYNQSSGGDELEMEEEEVYYEPWDETTMGPYPFPENDDSLTSTVLPYTEPKNTCDDSYQADDMSHSLYDDLLMTLTPERRRKLFKHIYEDDY